MAMFITRISKGRSIREIIVLLSLVAPVITCFWFTILGGTGLGVELESPGAITKAFETMDLPAGLLAITSHLPFSTLMTCLFLVLTTIFVATTGDSMTLAISMATTGDDKPNASIRVFLGRDDGGDGCCINNDGGRRDTSIAVSDCHYCNACFFSASSFSLVSAQNCLEAFSNLRFTKCMVLADAKGES